MANDKSQGQAGQTHGGGKPDSATQNQIDNTQAQISRLQTIVNDPNKTQEEKDQAQQSLNDQQQKLQRLQGGQTA